jgi:hypothetical protein
MVTEFTVPVLFLFGFVFFGLAVFVEGSLATCAKDWVTRCYLCHVLQTGHGNLKDISVYLVLELRLFVSLVIGRSKLWIWIIKTHILLAEVHS